MSKYHDAIYGRDNPAGESHGWIQWRGTDVCVDLYCKCGHHGHFDGYFLYFYECPQCHTKYAMGQNVKMIELATEEAVELERIGHNFKGPTNE